MFAGDVWTWTSIDAEFADVFMQDLADRLASRVQMTTDGHKVYLNAIEGAFGFQIDYVELVKLFGAAPASAKGRYSPAECNGSKKKETHGQCR